MKKIIALLLTLIFANTGTMPAQELDDMFGKRERMFQNLQVFYKQNNAFFGGKSKRDLERIIREYEKLIETDNHIIDAVQQQRQLVEKERDTVARLKNIGEYVNFQLENTLVDMNRRVIDLENANKFMQDQLHRARNDLKATELMLSKHKQRNGLLLVLVLLFFGGMALVAWLYYKKYVPGIFRKP